MKYYRIILLVKEGKLLFTDTTEHFMDKESYESGTWDKPITKVASPNGDLHFISFQKEYLESMIAGVALYKELRIMGWNE